MGVGVKGFQKGYTPWNKGGTSWNKGIPCTDEQKKKISEFFKGKEPWNKGISWSDEVREQIASKLRGKNLGQRPWRFKKGQDAWNKGLTTGPLSDECKRKLSAKFKGRKPWNAGQSLTLDHCKKISKSLNKYYEGHVCRVPTNRMKKMRLARKGMKYSEDHKRSISDGVSKAYVEGRLDKTNKPFKTGYFKSKKNNGVLHYRSSWELIVFKMLEKSGNIESYQYEPFPIEYRKEFGVVRKYVPDLLVKTTDGDVFIIEIKPKYRLNDELTLRKFRAAKKFCDRRNVKFKVLTEKEIFSKHKNLGGLI